jgi:hypothetical protein
LVNASVPTFRAEINAVTITRPFAVRSTELPDQPVRARQGDPSRHHGGVAALLVLAGICIGEQQPPQVLVAEAMDDEVTPADDLDQSGIAWRNRIDCPRPAAGESGEAFIL